MTINDPGSSKASAPSAATPYLRVSAEKVGKLMDLVGELSLSVSETIRSPDLAGLDLSEFEKSAHRLRSVVREVQDAAADLRMTPVEEVFRRMRRMVRELERQTEKEIELVVEGEDTQVDKAIVERLADALVHVVRNSADHGLELPDAREAMGKRRQGRITLRAAQVGSDIQITVSDDGRGLDRERILSRARERGLVAPDANPEDKELWAVIFQPGFSTAEAVTNLSGRGVGMDVLQTVVSDLRGRISVDSEWGRGTSVKLSLPLSLAFLDSLVMRVGRQLYAASIDNIAEIFKPDPDQITTVAADAGSELVKVRSQFLPVCRLQVFYGQEVVEPMPLDQQIIVVFNTMQGRIAVPVDEMRDQQQVVMKPLIGHLERIRASYGCALLGTGEVAIVMDSEKLRGTR